MLFRSLKDRERRILGLVVWALSFGLGLLISLFIVFVAFDTTMERYGTVYFLMTVVSIGFMILIPLDWLLGTKILPD
ncbi:MAG: hypothetical protein CUN55_03125 [Phototrophicales bacterium]|nr:MAG: hypothetical protein CUN55_03125 [Phototrophicales bacterium]